MAPILLAILLWTQPVLPPPLELEARAIEEMVIAPCCYTQQVSQHRSREADEMKQDIRIRLSRGESRQQILNAYEEKFGKRILAVPPSRGFDSALNIATPVTLVAGLCFVVIVIRRFRKTSDSTSHMHPLPADVDRVEAELRRLN
jgi:cytochrome c-type biogenesis protein CcmH/NrfF